MRYILTTDQYIYADSDEQALQLAESLAKSQRDHFDNHCQVKSLHSQQFGKLGSAEVVPTFQFITEQLLELISAKAINRNSICALLNISLPTLKLRLEDHKWKIWMVDRMTERYKLSKIILPE